MAIERDGKAPYAPANAVTEVLEFDRKRGLPAPVTLDTLVKVGVTESLAPRTFQALRLLDLLDEEGVPTPTMTELRRAPEADHRGLFASVLRNAYADVFAYVDPAEDDPTRVRDAFRGYQPTGQQERMVNLFLGLCAYAGLIEEIPPRKPAAPRVARPPASKRSRVAPESSRTRSRERAADEPAATGVPLMIRALLEQLPDDGKWTSRRRDRWLKAAELAVDMLYEVEEEPSSDD